MNEITNTYRLAVARPKGTAFTCFDCALCGYPEIAAPVFLIGPAGIIAVGSGCAAKALGIEVAEITAEITARSLVGCDARTSSALTWVATCLPSRVTAKFTAEMVEKFGADATATALAAYRSIKLARGEVGFRSVVKSVQAAR